jgi:multimeric flavodoxin WrbA
MTGVKIVVLWNHLPGPQAAFPVNGIQPTLYAGGFEMKISLINGSPKGMESNTNMMATAFLTGAQEAGAETVNIILADNEIKHCKGCFSCWFGTPGCCVMDDDMAGILSMAEGADILVLATPLRYGNISGLLKVFIERMVVFSNPYIVKDRAGETRHPKKSAESESPLYRSKLVLLAPGGLSQRAHFQVVSLWIKRLALNNLTEVLGEIYAPQGALLTNSAEELRPVIDNYLQLLKQAGQEIVLDSRISDGTGNLLEQNLIPEEIYLQQINGHFDFLLKNVKHPYVTD